MVNPFLRSAAKSLDQPLLLARLRRAVPVMLPVAGVALVGHDTYTAPEGERGKAFIRSLSVATATVASAFLAIRLFMRPNPARLGEIAQSVLETRALPLTKELGERLEKLASVKALEGFLKEQGINFPRPLRQYAEKAAGKQGLSPAEYHAFRVDNLVTFLKGRNTLDDGLADLLTKARHKVLSVRDVDRLHQKMTALAKDSEQAKIFLNQVIPEPANLTGREILGEIWNLSLLGLLPVLGGLAGGVTGSLLSGDNWREKFKNQAKEGFFQYFANIFLCNVGAGAFLYGLEKTPLKKSRPARFAAMLAGITAFGIVGGSAIANVFGKNLINPMIEHGPSEGFRLLSEQIRERGWNSLFKDLYAERRPEPLDVGLHVDDVATVGVLSGFKWIEPLLPFLYSISGWRTGIGYRSEYAALEKASESSLPPSPRHALQLNFSKQPAFSQADSLRYKAVKPDRLPASKVPPYASAAGSWNHWNAGYAHPVRSNHFYSYLPAGAALLPYTRPQYPVYPAFQSSYLG